MSIAVFSEQVSPLAASTVAAPPQIRTAIANAAQRENVSFDYLLAQARLESGLDPSARAKTSSAAGLFQFIESTWLTTMDRHGGARDGVQRQDVLAMRYDPATASQMAAALAGENRTGLKTSLGREPDHAELYLAHFLGLGGARTMLSADPATSAAALLPEAAKANRAIFYDNGSARNVGEVIGVIRDRMDAAKAQGAAAPPPISSSQRAFAAHTADALPNAPNPRRASMAETLRSAFAGSEHTLPPAAHDRVNRAYSRLAGLGL